MDLDGVIYLRSTLIPGALEFIDHLRSLGRSYLFLTNNSSRSRDQYAETLQGLGIPVTRDQIVTSAYATCRHLMAKASGADLLVVGEDGLRSELSEGVFCLVKEPPADFVVVGMDRHFTYAKLSLASQAIRSGARFISTNQDATYPTEEGLLPGAGSIVAAVRTASGRAPINMGKPSRRIFSMCSEILGIPAHRTAVIGDRVETDIIGGRKVGMVTVLVLSGVTAEEKVIPRGIRPDVVAPSIGHLLG